MASALFLLGAGGLPAVAQRAAPAEHRTEAARSVVLRPVEAGGRSVGVGPVGAALLEGAAQRAYEREYAATQQAPAPQEAMAEGTTAAFKRGALLGAGLGLAAGAAVGAALGGARNARVETALPGAMAGLALGAPAGVYASTGGASRYFWGTAGMAGAVAAGAAILLVESD